MTSCHCHSRLLGTMTCKVFKACIAMMMMMMDNDDDDETMTKKITMTAMIADIAMIITD